MSIIVVLNRRVLYTINFRFNDQSGRDGDSAGAVGGGFPDHDNGRRGEHDHDHSEYRAVR